MIQNLDAHLNKLQAQCDYLRHKLSTFPEGELSIQKNGSYHRWVIKNKEQSCILLKVKSFSRGSYGFKEILLSSTV